MKAQHYKVLGMGSTNSTAIYEGQFVSRACDDPIIRGFVSVVGEYSFDVILFTPDEIPNLPNYILLSEEIPFALVLDELTRIFENNKSIIPMWEKAYADISKGNIDSDELDH